MDFSKNNVHRAVYLLVKQGVKGKGRLLFQPLLCANLPFYFVYKIEYTQVEGHKLLQNNNKYTSLALDIILGRPLERAVETFLI